MFRKPLTSLIAPVLRRNSTLNIPNLQCRAFATGTTEDKKHPSDILHNYAVEIEDVKQVYAERKKRRQALVGTVVSTKCQKSITVMIKQDKFIHKYNMTLQSRKKIMAHDEEQKAMLGDIVRIVPCRPMSRKKRHSLIDIIQRPKSASVPATLGETPAAQQAAE